MNRKPVFDAVRRILGRKFTQAEVDAIDRAFDLSEGALPAGDVPAPQPATPPPAPPADGRSLGDSGATLIKKWEGCHRKRADGKFDAYPDPGSRDGKPWTIGWGSTGPDVRRGTVWTRAQCDARFDQDMLRYVREVDAAIGTAATSANQFDALVSFHYNTGKIASATLTKKHKAGDFAGARAEFGKWIYNDGKPMRGLVNRRADEAKLYSTA